MIICLGQVGRRFAFAPFVKILRAKPLNIIEGGGTVLWKSAACMSGRRGGFRSAAHQLTILAKESLLPEFLPLESGWCDDFCGLFQF